MPLATQGFMTDLLVHHPVPQPLTLIQQAVCCRILHHHPQEPVFLFQELPNSSNPFGFKGLEDIQDRYCCQLNQGRLCAVLSETSQMCHWQHPRGLHQQVSLSLKALSHSPTSVYHPFPKSWEKGALTLRPIRGSNQKTETFAPNIPMTHHLAVAIFSLG